MRTYAKGVGPLFAVCYFAYSSIYVARLNLSVASPLMIEQGILSKAQFGMIGGAFFFAFAFGKLPNGYFGDRLPAKLMIIGGLLLVGLANLLIGIHPAYPSIFVLWGLNGLGQSMIWGPMLRLVTDNVEPRHATVCASLLVSSVAAGSVLGLLVGAKCATLFGVMSCFFIPGLIAFASAIALWLFFRKRRPASSPPQTIIHLRVLVRRPEFYVMFVPAVLHGAIKDNVNLWLPNYYLDVHGIDVAAMASFIFIVPLIGFGGRLLFPVLYRLCGRDENRVLMRSFAVCVLAIAPLCRERISPLTATLCLGAISALISVVNTVVLSAYPLRFASMGNVSFVTGVMDFLTYGGAGVSSVAFGFLVERYGYSGMYVAWGCFCLLSMGSILVFFRNRGGAAYFGAKSRE